MAPGFTIRGFAESMRGKMPEEFTRIFGKSAKDLPPIICKQYRWWENHLAEVQEEHGKLSISCHSEAVPSVLSNTLDSNTETQQKIMKKQSKRKRTSRFEEGTTVVVVEEAASFAELQGHHGVEDSFTREVFTL
jgi:hypothetical protein